MKKLIILMAVALISSVTLSQTIESSLIKKINELRLQHGGPANGLSPFIRTSSLDSAAMYHAHWVVASGIGSHIESKSAKGIIPLAEFWDRSAKYGATAYCENLIQSCLYVKSDTILNINQTATRAFETWKKSPGHLANILFSMPKNVEPRVGIAIVPQPDGDSFCIVMVVGSNVDRTGHLIK